MANGVIDQVCSAFYDEMSKTAITSAVDLGRALGVLGLMLSLTTRFQPLLDGERFDWKKMIKPLFLFMCIVLYPQIFGGFEKLFFGLDEKTSHLSDSLDSRLSAAINTKAQMNAVQSLKNSTTYFSNTQALADQGKTAEAVSAAITNNPVGGLFQFGGDVIGWVVDHIVKFVAEIIYYGMYIYLKVYSYVMLIFLAIFGPIVIALSFTEWYQGGFPTWIGRVITTMMWMPVLNIVQMVVNTIHLACVNIDIKEIGNSDWDMGDDILGVIFYVVGIMMYFQVPKLAGFLVESAGVGGDNTGSIFGVVKSGASVAAGFAGASAGAMKGAAGGAMKGAAGAVAK